MAWLSERVIGYAQFEEKFGNRTIKQAGMLIVGRTASLGKREEQRLLWREKYVVLNSQTIHCKTFDQVCEILLDRLKHYQAAALSELTSAIKDRVP